MLHRQEVHIEESVNAICQASLLGLVQFGVLDVAGDALLPANLGEVVSFCEI